LTDVVVNRVLRGPETMSLPWLRLLSSEGAKTWLQATVFSLMVNTGLSPATKKLPLGGAETWIVPARPRV